ncbi:LysR family transcriptional regulator [Nocardia nova]|uniref:LysR family transcriptional regulator n=1 Tax=Nocardia nova TaxID=37330 RepID=UPI000CEA1AAC|nr:LysR family transcriptional regulator [Nocardia nova]
MGEFTVLGLRVVREAARCGSFSGAADRLGYTQSAVSRQISLMEQAAGHPLFERHARGAAPTAAGQVVVRHAEAVLAELDSTREQLDRLTAGPPATVRVGAFSTAMAALVPRAVAATSARVPLREGTSPRLLTAVARGRLDLAVVTETGMLPDDVEVELLLDDPLLVAVAPSHRLAGRISAAPAEFRGERWIAGSTEHGSTLLGAWRDSRHEPDIAFVARDWVAKWGLVAAGSGITVVPGIAVPVVPANIALLRIDHPAAVRPTRVVHNSARNAATSAATRAFIEALRDAAAVLTNEMRGRLRPIAAGSRTNPQS